MKPDQQQLQTIEDILDGATNYRETYTELYDHVLTALERVPKDTPFNKALYHIVENELGGKKGIGNIEAAYKKAAIKKNIKTYLAYFSGYLLSPFLLVAIVFTVFAYKLFTQSFQELGALRLVCMWLNAIPIVISKIIMAKTKRYGLYKKVSIIRLVYGWVGPFPLYFSLALQLIIYLVSLVLPLTLNAGLYINLSMFFLNIFNVLAVCRLCRDEFKLTVTI